jgi:putative photosynthetic complex assembly protein
MALAQIPMKHPEKELVPRFLVIAMFALMLGTVALVSFAQLAGVPNSGVVQDSPIVDERLVWLIGDRTGTSALADENGTIIATATAETKGGFIGVVGIAIHRGRFVHGVTTNEPIRVVRRENGRIGVIDDSTGEVLELMGYGADNVATFARLLD